MISMSDQSEVKPRYIKAIENHLASVERALGAGEPLAPVTLYPQMPLDRIAIEAIKAVLVQRLAAAKAYHAAEQKNA